MNAIRQLHLVGVFLALTVSLAAQVVPVNPPNDTVIPIGPPQKVTTRITLGQASLVESILPFPFPPPSPVNIAPGSDVEIFTPFSKAEIASITWLRLGSWITYTDDSLKISGATVEASGYYGANIKLTDGTSWTSDLVLIRVVAPVRQQLLNLSSRATISPANPTLISGFVVAQGAAKLNETKTLLIRAVGPSLSTVGVSNPLAAPELRLFRADGTEIIQARTQDRVYTSPAEVAAVVGAFPLLPGSKDAADIFTLPAGCFTAHVTSADGGSGDVLLEIYEIPADLPLWRWP